MKKKINNFFYKRLQSSKGFSLIEVMVSLAVLTLGISVFTTLMATSIKGSMEAKDQVIATGLAQEGVEIIHNYRDNNPTTFTSSSSNGDFIVDMMSSILSMGGSDGRLYLSGNYFRYTSVGTPTKFFRKVNIAITADANGKKSATVIGYVTWNGSGFGSISGFPGSCNVSNKCMSVTAVLPDVN